MVVPSLSALAGHCFPASTALLTAAQTTNHRARKWLEVNEKSVSYCLFPKYWQMTQTQMFLAKIHALGFSCCCPMEEKSVQIFSGF